MEQEPDWGRWTRKIFYLIEETEPTKSYIFLVRNTTVIKNYFYHLFLCVYKLSQNIFSF
jgi:hypothetical protein